MTLLFIASALAAETNPDLAVVAFEARVAALEEAVHQHNHEHAGVFEWQGMFQLQAGAYTWSFRKLEGAYGAHDTSMNVVLAADDGDNDESDELTSAVDMCLPSSKQPWREGDPPMTADARCYSVIFEESQDATVLRFEIAAAGAYLLFTEHLPSEFAAETGLADAAGDSVAPGETRLLTEKLTPSSGNLEAGEHEKAQDLLDLLGVALGAGGVLLGALALGVACVGCALGRKGAPRMQAATQMSAVGSVGLPPGGV